MCNVRKWSLRKQITVLFVVSTVIFLILLAIVVTINLVIMHNETRESVRKRLAANTNSNMRFIVQESGSALRQEITLLSSINTQLRSLLNITQGSVANLIDTSVFATSRNPTLTYSQLQRASGITFKTSSTYNSNSISLDASAVYYPDPTITTQTFTGQTDFNNFIANAGSLDKYLPSIFTGERAKNILFINIYYIKDNAEVLRVYPAFPIPSTYKPQTSTWYTATTKLASFTGTAWQKVIGPYIDEKGTGNKVFAISVPLLKDNVLIGAIAIEFLTSTIDQLVNSVSFLTSGEALLINSASNILSAPKDWQLSSSTVYSITSADVTSLVGDISSLVNTAAITQVSDETETTLPTVTRIISATDKTTTSYYVATVLFDSTQVTTSNWLYGLLLYTQVTDADQVNQNLVSLMNTDLVTIGVITLVAIIVTLSIVACVSFRISTKISRPLTKLMEFSELVHKNAANKTLCNKYFQGMENDEGIIGELIKVYKKVIGISAEPIKARYSKNQTSRKEEVEYPLNQFHADFITKTQGESPINWKDLINQIPNDKKID